MSAVVPTLGRSPWLVPCLEALRSQVGGRGPEGRELTYYFRESSPGARNLDDSPYHPERSEGSGRWRGHPALRSLALARDDTSATLGLREPALGIELEIVLVDQGSQPVELPQGLADRVLRPGVNLGFAGGTNRGIAAARGELIALVNDDALVEPGWLLALAGALAEHPRAAAAQGVNLQLDRPPGQPDLADGWGLDWNRAWQAVQLGTSEPPPLPSEPVREVFGVSATAALFRREALAAAALPGGQILDEGLGSYYEDADLACRLRAAGHEALCVPAARARHAGSVTGRTLGRARWAAIYGNRHLVLARHLGSAYWERLPALLARDLRDLACAVLAAEPARLAGIPSGWARAARRLPAYARRGAPSPPLADRGRLGIASPS